MSTTPGRHHPLRPTDVVIVVPCYNEEGRIDQQAFLDLSRLRNLNLLFVDDGSVDGTGRVLRQLVEGCDAFGILTLPRNMGKAEAVRRGLQEAIAQGAAIVGYLDADLATPGPELARIVQALEADDQLAAVFGSRVARLGSHIQRSEFRHFTGRVFATFASWALGVVVYDTQCGAKAFRVNDNLMAAIEEPFRSSWSFDVLLCQRLLDGDDRLPGLPTSAFLELPLESWHDVAESKVTVAGSAAAFWDVLAMGVARRWPSAPAVGAAGERLPGRRGKPGRRR